ncbi:hypothetical protein AAG570_009061 [Ranatra chinensis]|uniref:Band 7 domain-containing protein n=1 Tax=Ranatra chinensis TaxID=642074 RepID=A0ABD0YT10_9HEMI
MGRLESKRPLAAGILLILPCTDFFIKVDMRIETFDVPSQEVLTIDSVTVHVDAVVYYRVHEPLKAVINVLNYRSATILLAATLLRNMIGTKNLTSLLSEREHLASSLQAALEAATDNWGITVERVEIKDVRLPLQMQRAMAAEAEASREAKAKVIAAQGELDASRALKEAAEVMVQAKGALQLRYLQTLCTIAAEKNSTIVFPLPIDLLTGHMNS